MALTRASAAVVKTEELVNNRNLVINGAMQVAQRGTSVTGITTGGYYTADRWFINPISAGTWTSNVESSGPTNTEFRSSANVICTTADSSLAASDLVNIQYRFEGQNVQGIKKGTSAAESLTLSFWVKSSNTGTYICEFTDVDNTRHISKSYTIDAANTWEKKTITLPPDTTGQFDNDNGLSFLLSFHLAAGSDRTSGTLADTAWVSIVQANRVVGQLNLANAVGNYFAWTGVQLEIGSTATPFERRPFGTELALCQRYCPVWETTANGDCIAIGQVYGSTTGLADLFYPVTPRTKATGISTTGSFILLNSAATGVAATLTFNASSLASMRIVGTVSSGLTAGNATALGSSSAAKIIGTGCEL